MGSLLLLVIMCSCTPIEREIVEEVAEEIIEYELHKDDGKESKEVAK